MNFITDQFVGRLKTIKPEHNAATMTDRQGGTSTPSLMALLKEPLLTTTPTEFAASVSNLWVEGPQSLATVGGRAAITSYCGWKGRNH